MCGGGTPRLPGAPADVHDELQEAIQNTNASHHNSWSWAEKATTGAVTTQELRIKGPVPDLGRRRPTTLPKGPLHLFDSLRARRPTRSSGGGSHRPISSAQHPHGTPRHVAGRKAATSVGYSHTDALAKYDL